MQLNGLDGETRRVLWNLLSAAQTDLWNLWDGDRTTNVQMHFWTGVLGQFRDTYVDGYGSTWPMAKHRVLEGSWFGVFDILESQVEVMEREGRIEGLGCQLANDFNLVFERMLVGYRFIDLQVTPIDTEQARRSVEGALSSPHAAVRHHLERGLALLANRQAPDHPNSIKESVSAVESAVRVATGAATLGDGIKRLREAGVAIHPALEKAWAAMYGWTSDASGIRHGGAAAPEPSQALAKYMLVSCSAFVSYLLEVGHLGPAS